MREGHIWLVVMIVVVLCWPFAGCASITPKYNKGGQLVKIESAKFLADLTYEEELEFAADGKTVLKRKVKYATSTTADRIMDSATSMFGTLFNGVTKAMP